MGCTSSYQKKKDLEFDNKTPEITDETANTIH
jgi:hypothetical protein